MFREASKAHQLTLTQRWRLPLLPPGKRKQHTHILSEKQRLRLVWQSVFPSLWWNRSAPALPPSRNQWSCILIAVSLCAWIAQSAMIAAARATPVATMGANSAVVSQKAAFQRNSTAIMLRSFRVAHKDKPRFSRLF